MRVLITCPPMLRSLDALRPRFASHGIDLDTPAVVQTLSERELIGLVPTCDGWIIGDDPATRAVFAAGKAGRLKGAVKWGVGVDNVDFAAARELGIPIAHTPAMFGREVADLAMAYVTTLARQLVAIDRGVRAGQWPKPAGVSLAGRTSAVVGYGDIGRHTARRLLAAEMRVVVYDPAADALEGTGVELARWPDRIGEADFVVVACALTPANRHMIDEATLALMRPGVRIVNVSRGPLIDEAALAAALDRGRVTAAALDVFEEEPLPPASPLRRFDQCVFGSHNGSNTIDAVHRATDRAVELLFGFLGIA
jgi:D-3-phosphoglycerate dehydrogenase / 2-oxoglutarate reductase